MLYSEINKPYRKANKPYGNVKKPYRKLLTGILKEEESAGKMIICFILQRRQPDKMIILPGSENLTIS